MSSTPKYKLLHVVVFALDALICLILLLSLGYFFHRNGYFPAHFFLAFLTYFILLVAFSMVFFVFLRTHSYTSYILSLALSAARILTYLIMLVTFMTFKTLPQEDRDIEQDPYRWIAYRKVLLCCLAAFVISLCAIETVIILKYHSKQIRGRLDSQEPINANNDVEAQ